MPAPTTETFGKFVLKVLKSGGNPELANDYEKPCGLTSRGFVQTASVQETLVPDCDDDDKAAPVSRAVQSTSGSFSGSGVLAMEWRARWQAFYDGNVSRYCRIYIDVPSGEAGGYWQGKFVLSNLSMNVEKGDLIKISLTLDSDGAVPWTDTDA